MAELAKAFDASGDKWVDGAIAGGGSAVGLLLGGVLTEYADWRWCFWVNLPVAIFAIVAPNFFTLANFFEIVRLNVELGLLAVALTLVLSTRMAPAAERPAPPAATNPARAFSPGRCRLRAASTPRPEPAAPRFHSRPSWAN